MNSLKVIEKKKIQLDNNNIDLDLVYISPKLSELYFDKYNNSEYKKNYQIWILRYNDEPIVLYIDLETKQPIQSISLNYISKIIYNTGGQNMCGKKCKNGNKCKNIKNKCKYYSKVYKT